MPGSLIGRSLPQVNAAEKVSGAAMFVADLKLPGMLHAKVLRSASPHARIVRIDTERARRLPGVKAVVTGADTPHVYGALRHHKDQHVLAVERVRFVGEEIAAVAAVDENTALDALEMIRVEYEDLPAVFDPEEALRPDAPLLHTGGNLAREIRIDRGDVEAGLRQAAVVHEATYETPYQYHGFTEPMGTVASADVSGRLTVWMPTQSVHFSRRILAEGLGLPVSRVRVVQTFVGGGFGGKFGEDANPFIAALLALATRRPVRLINTRVEDFQGARSAMPARITLTMGVDRDGRITAKDTSIVADNGAYCGLAPEIVHVTAMRQDSLYRLENIRTVARLAYTNKLPSGAFRGFGGPQMAFALESHVDGLAERLGMDPLELRLRNAIRAGDTSVHGWTMGSCGLTECLETAARAIDWRGKRAAANRATGPLRRGMGLACAIHVTANRQMANWDGSSVAIKVNEDGRMSLITAEADIGQGAATVLTQIAAEVLGIPPVRIPANVNTQIAPT